MWLECESKPWAHNSLNAALATMMPVLSSVSVKSLRVGKTFQSGITYTQSGPAAILRASSRGHVSISHARSTRLPEETSGGYF